ncbi:hypothetical protein H671_2g7236 [Cricetulus griseus]|nr:hypothetical protein H671_2g7236 [Cricetulus griseus]
MARLQRSGQKDKWKPDNPSGHWMALADIELSPDECSVNRKSLPSTVRYWGYLKAQNRGLSVLNGRPPHKAEWTSMHLPNGRKQRPSGKPRPAADEASAILAEENGLSLSLFVIHPSDGDVVNNMYEPDPDLLAGQSAEEETEDSILSPIPMGPPSPFPTSEDFTPKEGSPYEAPVYIPEDIPIPPDFELRESSIPGAGLGIWAKRKMEIGERLGPYVVAPRAALKEADFGWEGTSWEMPKDGSKYGDQECGKSRTGNNQASLDHSAPNSVGSNSPLAQSQVSTHGWRETPWVEVTLGCRLTFPYHSMVYSGIPSDPLKELPGCVYSSRKTKEKPRSDMPVMRHLTSGEHPAEGPRASCCASQQDIGYTWQVRYEERLAEPILEKGSLQPISMHKFDSDTLTSYRLCACCCQIWGFMQAPDCIQTY